MIKLLITYVVRPGPLVLKNKKSNNDLIYLPKKKVLVVYTSLMWSIYSSLRTPQPESLSNKQSIFLHMPATACYSMSITHLESNNQKTYIYKSIWWSYLDLTYAMHIIICIKYNSHLMTHMQCILCIDCQVYFCIQDLYR